MKTQTNATDQKIISAKISDYTGYDSTMGMNAGKYGFWEKYEYVGDGKYRHTYHTSASGFAFCECCGNFRNGCCEYPETVEESEVWQAIANAEKNPSDDIYAEYQLFDDSEWLEKLRRRVRDALNKTSDEKAIISCAARLDVHIG